MAIVSVGIDLAKKVFPVHGVIASGKPARFRPTFPIAKLLESIGIGICPGLHDWTELGGR